MMHELEEKADCNLGFRKNYARGLEVALHSFVCAQHGRSPKRVQVPCV
jgi:hypothetical protein